MYFHDLLNNFNVCTTKTLDKECQNLFPYILWEVAQTLLLEIENKNIIFSRKQTFNLDFLSHLYQDNSLLDYRIIKIISLLCSGIDNLLPQNKIGFSVKPVSFIKKKNLFSLEAEIANNDCFKKNYMLVFLRKLVEDIKDFVSKQDNTSHPYTLLDKSKNIIKTSLHLENQKFGKKPKVNEEQLDLFPNIFTQAKEVKVEVIGLDFQPSHYQALGAIQSLLAKTNYSGNTEGVYLTRDTNSFKFEGRIPKIKFSRSRYLEAYGVKKYLTSRNKMEFGGKESVIALEALQYLGTQPHLIIATRKRWQNRLEVVDRYQTLSPILRICEGWEGLTPIENRSLDEGRIFDALNMKHKGFVVEPCPLLVDQIDSYFVLKPANIYQEIKLKFPNASRFAYTFIDWIVKEATLKKINNLNHYKLWPEKLEIGLESLSYILRMDSYIKSRNWKKITMSIKRCVEIAVELGWLLEHRSVEGKTVNKKEVFFLNKNKFNQISSK